MIKIILEAIKSYIGYFMAIVGFVSFIYAQGIKAEARLNNNSLLESKVEKVITEQLKRSVEMDSLSKKMDIITFKIDNVSTSQVNLRRSIDGVKKSFSLYLLNDSLLDKKTFVLYMEAMESKKVYYYKSDPKINIEKIK
jgi:hypothetical protein